MTIIITTERNVTVNFKPDEYIRKMFFFFQSVTRAAHKKKSEYIQLL